MRQINSWIKASLFAALFILTSVGFSAQAQSSQIPQDPKVRIGKLDNGLTYYIRKNDQPANRADFYIAQKVGAIQEEPSQRGLAHFLEHMCFNGTTHFPGNQLIQYLESIGVKFGENLNAYTSIDETVYNISNVPVTVEGAIDSCLYILHDWSNDLILDPKEIDKERGVITEEWRTRMSAGQRYMDNTLPVIFKDTKYSDCLPIGDIDVVNNFKYQTLRDYYEKWYRPDLQGIIIVGDIDVDQIENKIKTIFADIPAQPDAAERVYFPVNDNKEPIVVSYKDKEQTNVMFNIYSKHDVVPREAKGDISYLQYTYAVNMITTMLDNRLNEIAEQANSPYVYAGVYDGSFIVAQTKNAFTGAVVCKEDNIKAGIQTLLNEIERMRQHGFTASEYARARANYLSGLESSYNEREKTKNAAYVNEYVRLFLDNEPAPGIDFEYTIMSAIAPQIPVEAINQLIPGLLTENNKVLSLFAPEKEGLVLPTNEELVKMFNATTNSKLEPYVDQVSDEPLLSEEPTGGKVVKEETNTIFGTTTLTLSNGVKVIVKPTTYKADQIIMSGYSYGGNSQFEDSEFINFSNINSVALIGGIGSFSNVELSKVLAGKLASVNTSVGYLTESVSGFSAPKDFETMMQLTYLNFTSPRKDQEAFESFLGRQKALLANAEMNPSTTFGDSIRSAMYNNHPRATRIHAEDLDKINYDRVIEMYKDRFKDASDFTFILVGNIDLAKDKPLIEKYLGGLPSIDRKENFIDRKIDTAKGMKNKEFIKKQDHAKASIFTYYTGNTNYTFKNKMLMNILSQVMTLVYTEKVREDEGGTYGVGVQGGISKLPTEEGSFIINFDTDPDKRAKLMEIIYREIDNVCENGASKKDLDKVKESMLKQYSELLNENGYWSGAIDEYLRNGINIVEGYEDLIKSITNDEIKAFAKDFFGQKNRIEVVMISPEEK